jgi:hypothetical protein
MQPPLIIELPDEDLVEALQQRLRDFDVDTVQRDAHWELEIQLLEPNPEPRVAKALHEIDAWLLAVGMESVRVRLNGDAYDLQARSGPADQDKPLERDIIARQLGEGWQAAEPGIYRYVGPAHPR